MAFKHNPALEDLIATHGQTVGLPLFESAADALHPPSQLCRDTSFKGGVQVLPGWIWDGTGIKAEVYKRLESSFNKRQLQVLCAFMDLGKATDHEVAEYLDFPINWINGRRNELVKMGVIVSYGETKIGPYGQPNCYWNVNYKNLREILFACL